MIEIDNYWYTDDRKYRGQVSQEYYPINPREWDNLGHMICFHDRYNLGDETTTISKLEDEAERKTGETFNMNDWTHVRTFIEEHRGGVLIFPLGLYDHSGISMYIGETHDRWDGMPVGFIYVTRDDMIREGIDDLKSAEEVLRHEVKVYNSYLTGEVYRFDTFMEVNACSCGECKQWEAMECNSEYIDYREAEKDMKEWLEKCEPAKEVVK